MYDPIKMTFSNGQNSSNTLKYVLHPQIIKIYVQLLVNYQLDKKEQQNHGKILFRKHQFFSTL